MLNGGKKFRALRDKKNKYSNSRVVPKKNSERNKKPPPPPLQVKWSFPNASTTMKCWRWHSNSVNTGNRRPSDSDVKTRKRRNVVGIDMIRNNRIDYDGQETFLKVRNGVDNCLENLLPVSLAEFVSCSCKQLNKCIPIF
jgi:hypothetical protein